MVRNDVAVQFVLADRMFTSSEDVQRAIKALSKAAADLSLPKIITELGQTEIIGKTSPDILDNVPEVKPVLRAKVCIIA
jgi:DNA-directed RNA polymerase, mitochondrial